MSDICLIDAPFGGVRPFALVGAMKYVAADRNALRI
jgi:hypothetical protein